MTKASELYQHAKRYCLHSALANLGIACMKLFTNDVSLKNLRPATLNEFQIAFIAKALILNSNDYRQQKFEDKGLFNCANLFNNLYEPFMDIPEDWSPEQKLDATNMFLVRMANQQFPFQTRIGSLVPRALFLFDEIPQEIKNPKIDVKKEIENIYDLTPKQIMIVGFAIFAKSADGYFNPENLINTESSELKKHLTREVVEKFISLMKADYDTLRDIYRADEGKEGFEQYAFNALRTYPIVQTQIAGFVIPVPRFIIERISNGIFYSLMDKFKAQNSNPFLEFFGKEIFEVYVKKLFSLRYKNDELITEFEYKNGKRKIISPDLILLEGDEAILIECKTSGITREAKSWGDKEKLIEDLKIRVVKAIMQMDTFVKDFNKGLVSNPKLKKIKNFRFVVVTYDRIFLSGSPAIRNLINRELVKNGLNNFNYQIMGIDEVEVLLPVLQKFRFGELIDAKISNDDWATHDFDVFLGHFIEDKGVDIERDNPLLREKFDKLMQEISPNIGLKKDNR